MKPANEDFAKEDEGNETLEAEHVYILMKKEYMISRNVRADWYLKRINSIITVPNRDKLSDYEGELEVVSVIPVDVPPEWDYDTSHLYKYKITQQTNLHFLARKYRLVFCLDLSPSTSIVDVTKGSVVLEEVFATLRQCLKGVVRPFYVPGSQLLFQPKVYLTIIAHTPFFKSQSQQVLVQGWLLMLHNLDAFLENIHTKLTMLEAQLAQATAQTYGQMDIARERSEIAREKVTGMLFDESVDSGTTPVTNPMVSPDVGFVNMLRYGIVALQLLPENSSAGIVVITDGVISLPDATMFDSLLVQLRNQTIACSFLQLGSVYHPQASLGFVPFSDLMHFLAMATCGAYMSTLPPIEDDYEYDMNEYHKSLLLWGFQNFMHGINVENGYYATSRFFNLQPIFQEATELIRKKEKETQLNTTLNAVLSCRLREGYTIKEVAVSDDQIQLILVLPWKYSIFIEYHMRALWPPTQSSVHTEVWIEATYEFLNDVTNDLNHQLRSKYRQRMVAKYWSTLQHLRETDIRLVEFQSFTSNQVYFTIPDCVKSGYPVFYLNPGQSHPISAGASDQFPQFATFWKLVCSLDTNIWQKWMHTHRIGVILEHDHPLPKNLHITNASGRYGIVQCRQAELALTTLLTDWCDFVLIENHSYVKFLREDEPEKPPISFFVVRIMSKPPPCIVIRIAFLGGTPGNIRNQLVRHLSERIQGLTFPSRMGLSDRSKSLSPSTHQSEEKLNEGVGMTLSPATELRETGLRPVLTRAASNIPCCVTTHKPIEKILIWYEKVPSNLLSCIVQESSSSASTRYVHSNLGATKSATNNMSLLSRYLHHRRWIWSVQAPSAPAVSLNAVARILNTLARIRLQEGFNFAYSCNGIITMVREFDMKLELRESDDNGLLESNVEGSLETFPCVAQYVIFPPHVTNSARESTVDEDWEEGDSIEADGELQVVTECWIEPQNGAVISPSPHVEHYHNCNYRQMAQAFFPVDQECIWGLLTFEHLLSMSQGHGNTVCGLPSKAGMLFTGGIGGGGGGPVPQFSLPPVTTTLHAAPRITQVPFTFDLIRLLPKCQQVELLVSTYIQDLYSSLVKRVTFGGENTTDEANQILYGMLLDHLSQLHDNQEFPLSTADLRALPKMLRERQRPPTSSPSPFSNTYISDNCDPPKWRCFLKGVSHNHLMMTLIPASYHDLKSLLVKRANLSDGENLAVKVIPDSENTLDLDTETNTTDQPIGGPMSEQQVSFESSTSSLTHLTSPSLPPPTPTNNKSNGPAVEEIDGLPPRMRYRSGPVVTTQSQPTHPVFSDSVLRERASSFHVNRERCSSFGQGSLAPERSRTGSVDSPTKDPHSDLTVTESPKDPVKRRYVSMPSKSLPGFSDPSVKSMSSEALRDDGCVPLHLRNTGAEVESVGRGPSTEESQSAVPPSPCHKFLFGAVTLPIYVYDCKLNSIITQLVNREERSYVVGKDIFMDSTFKLEHDLIEDTVPLKDEELPSLSGIQDDNKLPSPEPRSEESDVGVDSSFLRTHVGAVEVCHLRSFVLGVFQSLQKELMIHKQDMEAALNHCHEAVMEIEISHFLQTICGHLRDFRLRSNIEQLHHSHSATPKPQDGGEEDVNGREKATDRVDDEVPSRPKPVPSTRFPLSLLKQHLPCRDLQQLHSMIKERFSGILQGSFRPVPSLPEYYFFSPQSLHRSNEGTPVGDFIYVSSRDLEDWDQAPLVLPRHRKLRRVSVGKRCDSFAEGEEDIEDATTINGCDEEEEELGEEEEDEDDHDKSIEFRSDIGSSVYRRLHSRLTSMDGDEDKTSVISERDEDLSTLPDNLDFMDGMIPPLFLHLTCTVRFSGHVESTLSVKTVPTCLDEIVHSLSSSEREVDLSTVSVTLDVLCMTLPPALATHTMGETIAALLGKRASRLTSVCSTASPQLKRGRSVSESTCASMSDMEDSYLDDDDQLGHLPNYQHQAVISTVEEIKWLLRDEIASAMLHVFPLTKQTLEMVAAHVESSKHAGNCISETVPLNFVCGIEQSRDKFIQEFGRLSVAGHHLEKEGLLYYVVQDKNQIRRRHFSSLVPPLGFKSQFIIVRPHPHADDAAQLRQMESGNTTSKVSLSSPDVKTPAKLHTTRVLFDSDRRTLENIGDGENLGQRGEKWMRRRERKERRDSERRGSINSTDSDSEIEQGRPSFSRDSSYQSHDGRTRFSESPKKNSDVLGTSSRKSQDKREGEESGNGSEQKEVKRHPRLVRSGPCLTPSLCDNEYPLNLSKEADPIIEGLEQLDQNTKTGHDESKKTEERATLSNKTSGESVNTSTESKASVDQDIPEDREEKNGETKGSGKIDHSTAAKDENVGEDTPVSVEGSANVSSRVAPETAAIEPAKSAKEAAHRLSLPLNELIRCGSESLPRTQLSTEVIRKSASTDNFVPSVTEAAMDQFRSNPSSIMTVSVGSGLWAELIKNRQNSSELKSRHNSGASADILKSRHNSGAGGDMLKSRHNSGTGSVPGGLYSDVSSLLESGQTTEDGCEGDISDSDNECCDWLQDFEAVRPFLPEFWLILRVSSDCVDTFFHCRSEGEVSRLRSVQAEVVRSVRALVKLVNQTLLLQDLHSTRMCNRLLEPDTSEDIWRHEETKGRNTEDGDADSRGVLEASLKFKAGAFACRVVWETKFELHPKVKLCAGKVGSKGIQALRTILNPISVNNRKNMFVYEDTSGNGPHVFYLRLNEQQTTSVSPQVEGRRDEGGLSHSSSVVSLGKRGSRDDDPLILKNELRPRVSSFGEKDVIMEGVPSTPAQRKRNHYIILTVHGIAEPGSAIKEELVRMLQNRLDEAVVENICVVLWNNPQHKLSPEDVHFIQPPYQPPKTTIRFTINAYALPYLQAVGYYLKQNMLSCGFIHPKFTDNRPEHHFQDFSATDQDLCSEPNIFLFVRPRKSAAKGIACIAFSLVDGKGNTVQLISCQRPNPLAYQEVFSKQEFEALTHTQECQEDQSKCPGPMSVLQFKVWESGRVDLDEVRRYLVDSISHALFDVNTEYRLLTAPLILGQEKQYHTAPVSEPSTPKKDTTQAEPVRSVSLMERNPNRAEDRMRSISVSGVPPHVCLPHMTSRLGLKRSVHGTDSRGDSLKDQRAPSPLTLVQARLRLMSNSVPDLKLRGRRASLQSPWDNSSGNDSSAPTSSSGHSPLKIRHSVDFGMEHSQLIVEDGLHTAEKSPWDIVDRSSATLHPLFSELLLDWLEYASELGEKGEHAVRKELGEKGGEHAVRKYTQHISTRHAIPVFITELQKWVSSKWTEVTTEIFEEMDVEGKSPVYKLVESGKPPNVLKSRSSGGYDVKKIIIVSRNNKQWWSSIHEDNFHDYYMSTIKPSKATQRYPPLIVWPKGQCISEEDSVYPRPDSGQPPSGLSTPVTAPPTGIPSSMTSSSVGTSAIPISTPVTVPSTPTSLSSAVLWPYESTEALFIPRQKLLYATIVGEEIVIYTYNWTKEHCDALHIFMNCLAQWTKARSRLLSTVVVQKMGLFHNQPFGRKTDSEEDNPNFYSSATVEALIKAQAPISQLGVVNERGGRRSQTNMQVPGIGDVYRDSRPIRCLRNSAYGNLKVLELRHGNQMLEIKRLRVQKENQRKVLVQMISQSPGHASPAFDEKILDLYKQTARFVHFCYTPMLFLPRWRWQVAAVRDHSLPNEELGPEKATALGFKTPENQRSRHDSGSSMKGAVSTGPAELRRTLSLMTAVSSPAQRKRHITGGDDKWHGSLCMNFLKEYIQYLQSLGFLSLSVTKGPLQKGATLNRERETRSFWTKEVRFNEHLSTESTYLMKNVLGGIILLEIFFTEPYFAVKVYVLESIRLQGRKLNTLSSQTQGVIGVVVSGPPAPVLPSPHSSATLLFPEGCPPDHIDDKFATNYFMDEVDSMKVLLHVHSFTYDFHLRSVCAYVTDRQLLFHPGYHVSSFLNDFIKYYNKGPNFARNMVYSAHMKVLDTGTPGEQLYNYLLAREKQYGVKVLRMKPIFIDPDSDMQETEFIMVYNETCRMGYSDANEQRVTDEYDVSVLVTHDLSEDGGDVANQQTDALHLKVYIILSSKREMYPNRTLDRKKGIFRTVYDVPTLRAEKAEKAAASGLKVETIERKGDTITGTPVTLTVIEDGKEVSSSFSEWTRASMGTEGASPVLEYIPSLPSTKEILPPPPLKSHSGIRLESVRYLGYYTHYEQKIHTNLHNQALQAQRHIHFIFNQAKIHCRRDWLWQRLTAVLREDEKQKIARDQVLSNAAYSELCELLSLVQVTSLSTIDPNLAPFFSKPLQWYQGLTRVLQAKYQDRYRSLTSNDGNIQHLLILSPSCPEAFMMLSTNLHLQKAELSCINKQLRNEEKVIIVTNTKIMGILTDFVNACCYHLWTGLL